MTATSDPVPSVGTAAAGGDGGAVTGPAECRGAELNERYPPIVGPPAEQVFGGVGAGPGGGAGEQGQRVDAGGPATGGQEVPTEVGFGSEPPGVGVGVVGAAYGGVDGFPVAAVDGGAAFFPADLFGVAAVDLFERVGEVVALGNQDVHLPVLFGWFPAGVPVVVGAFAGEPGPVGVAAFELFPEGGDGIPVVLGGEPGEHRGDFAVGHGLQAGGGGGGFDNAHVGPGGRFGGVEAVPT